MTFHEKLKYVRLQKNLTQKYVALKVELNIRQYQRYENGEQIPTAPVLSRLCHFFKIPSGFFLDYDILDDILPEQNKIFDSLFISSSYFNLLEEIYTIEQKTFKAISLDKKYEWDDKLIQILKLLEENI